MMEQPTFADVDYESKKRKTRREKFLERMEGCIRPFYPTAGRGTPSLYIVGDATGTLRAVVLQPQ